MSPLLQQNFADISSKFGEPLPADVPLRVTIEKVSLSKKNNKDQLQFEMVVTEPAEHKDRKVFDFVMLQKDNGEDNKIGYGQVKAYTEAALGDEAANGTQIDTDALVGQGIVVILKNENYTKDGQQKTAQRVAKILPQG